MLLLRNLPVHRVSKLPLFGTNFMLLTLYSHPFFQHLHLAISYRFFHTYIQKQSRKRKISKNQFFYPFFLEKCYYRNYSSYTQMIKEQYFPLKCYSNIGSPTKKICKYIIIEFHFPKFYEDSISIFIVFRMRCGGCFLSKLFKSSLIVLTAERSQKLLIENSKFGNNDLFYKNIFHSK